MDNSNNVVTKSVWSKISKWRTYPNFTQNARDNRIYHKRRTTNNLWRTEPLYWLVLRIQTGAPLSVIRKSVWLLPIRNSHIFDHKYLFAPPILRPQYTPIAYPSQIGAQYNATLTIPPHRATFPAEVQTYQVNNHHWQYQRYWGCQSHQFSIYFSLWWFRSFFTKHSTTHLHTRLLPKITRSWEPLSFVYPSSKFNTKAHGNQSHLVLLANPTCQYHTT